MFELTVLRRVEVMEIPRCYGSRPEAVWIKSLCKIRNPADHFKPFQAVTIAVEKGKAPKTCLLDVYTVPALIFMTLNKRRSSHVSPRKTGSKAKRAFVAVTTFARLYDSRSSLS